MPSPLGALHRPLITAREKCAEAPAAETNRALDIWRVLSSARNRPCERACNVMCNAICIIVEKPAHDRAAHREILPDMAVSDALAHLAVARHREAMLLCLRGREDDTTTSVNSSDSHASRVIQALRGILAAGGSVEGEKLLMRKWRPVLSRAKNRRPCRALRRA